MRALMTTAAVACSLSVLLGMGGTGDRGSTTTAGPTAAGPEAGRYTFTIQSAPRLRQDVWVSALGTNDGGWNSGGSICLGPLAQGFVAGESATILTKVTEAGVMGVDGSPVPMTDAGGDPIVYTAPSDELGPRDFTLTAGTTFYTIIDGFVVHSSREDFPTGLRLNLMFTWDAQRGYHTAPFVLWFQDPDGEWFPFLNEGVMMANIRQLR